MLCLYFVVNPGQPDRRRTLRCEHCAFRKQACTFKRESLPALVRQAYKCGSLFITSAWSHKHPTAFTSNVIIPAGQSIAVWERAKEKGFLKAHISFVGYESGKSSTTSASWPQPSEWDCSWCFVDVSVSDVFVEGGSIALDTNAKAFHSLDVRSRVASSAEIPIASFKHIPVCLGLQESSQNLNTLRLLARRLQDLAVSSSVSGAQVDEVAEMIEDVHQALGTVQDQLRDQRIVCSQQIYQL
jgi:hypothetical protein